MGVPISASRGRNYITYVRASNREARILAFHDSVNPKYWEILMGHLSPDGKLVLLKSNMNNSGRGDVFLAIVPTG